MPTRSPRLAAALDRLISGSRSDAPPDFLFTVRESAHALGARSAEVYVQDYAQRRLFHLADGHEVRMEDSPVGEAYARTTSLQVAEPDGVRLWVALRDGTDRRGVMGLLFDHIDGETIRITERFASIVAEMMVSRGQLTDRFVRLRRTMKMGLAAEMQWELLPPLAFRTDHVAVAGILEPAYTVGGDAFDYAYDDRVRIGVFDAMGHGVQSALTSGLAVNAYRHARRSGSSLEESYREIDAAIAEHRPAGFVTAILAELHPETGSLRWINAGHPPLRVLRGGVLLDLAGPEPSLPCGLGAASAATRVPDVPPQATTLTLEKDDLVAFITDGAIEQRNASEQPFGEQRLIGVLAGLTAEGLAIEETLRRAVTELLDYAADALKDDATLVLLQYRGP